MTLQIATEDVEGLQAADALRGTETQRRVDQMFQGVITFVNANAGHRDRLREIDLTYMRESAAVEVPSTTAVTGPVPIPDIVIPLVQPQIETGVSRLQRLLISGTPIFGLVADPAIQPAADMMEAIIHENSIMAAWAPNIIKGFRDSLKYNIAGTETRWTEDTSPLFVDKRALAGTALNKDVERIVWAGNTVKRIDPYNLMWDYRTAPNNVHSEGEFVGYAELHNYMVTRRKLAAYGKTGLNVTRALNTPHGHVPSTYYVPQLRDFPNTVTSTGQWAPAHWRAWATGTADPKFNNTVGMYEWTYLYMRVVPNELKISGKGITNLRTPQVWYFVFCNGIFVHGRRIAHEQDTFPLVMSQAIDDGLALQTKSMQENITPFQELATSLWRAELWGARREVVDRLVFDPLSISPELLRRSGVLGHIPVNMNALNKNLDNIIKPIPYQRPAGRNLVGNAAMVSSMASEVAGTNRVTQGQFQAGNKSVAEFNAVMRGSDAYIVTLGYNLTYSMLRPMQLAIMRNMLLNQRAGTVQNVKDARAAAIRINPQTLQEVTATFKIADGLTPAADLLNEPMMAQFMAAYGASRQLQAEVDMGGLWNYLLAASGYGNPIAPFTRRVTQAQVQASSGAGIVPTTEPTAEPTGDAANG